VLKCLARYTHRVAIGNARLQKLEDGRVTCRYKDYAEPKVAVGRDLIVTRITASEGPRWPVSASQPMFRGGRHSLPQVPVEECRRLLQRALQLRAAPDVFHSRSFHQFDRHTPAAQMFHETAGHFDRHYQVVSGME
jgi:hypothetical protein